MLTTPIITRLLDIEEYGITSAFTSWENLLIIIINFALYKAMLNLCARYDDHVLVLSNILKLNCVIFLFWNVFFLIFRHYFSDITGFSYGIITCLVVGSFFHNIMSSWMVCMQYDYSYKIAVIVMLIYTVCSAGGCVFALILFSRTAESKIYTQTLSVVAIGLEILYIYIIKKRSRINLEIWKYALGFCLPLMPHYLSEILLSSSDRIMINSMCGASDTAIYSIAYSVGSIIMMVTSAINAAFAPYQYQKIKSGEYTDLAKNTNKVIALVAVGLLLIMMFGREIVLIFGGYKYVDSIDLIIPISLGIYFNYVFQLFARVQEYYGQKHTIVLASVLCAVLNVLLNYIFINLFGYRAAAYTTFVCYFAFCFLHFWFYRIASHKYAHQDIYDSRGLCRISIILLLISILIHLARSHYILKYSVLSCMLAVCIIKWKDLRKDIFSW